MEREHSGLCLGEPHPLHYPGSLSLGTGRKPDPCHLPLARWTEKAWHLPLRWPLYGVSTEQEALRRSLPSLEDGWDRLTPQACPSLTPARAGSP